MPTEGSSSLITTEYKLKRFKAVRLFLEMANLAIYSAMHTFLINRLRIRKIYNHDGPGFMKHIIESRRYKCLSGIYVFFSR